MAIRRFGLAIARTLGTDIIDQRTGKSVGRALLLPWRGKIHVIGLEAPVRVIWIAQQRLTYWKQEIGFATHPKTDFPNIRTGPPGETRKN